MHLNLGGNRLISSSTYSSAASYKGQIYTVLKALPRHRPFYDELTVYFELPPALPHSSTSRSLGLPVADVLGERSRANN